MVYNNFSGYLKKKYGGKTKKICIDGGFSCPNRDGTCGFGGCIFCGERGAGEHIENAKYSISEQVYSYFSNQPKADNFIAYFQNFTNTYAPVDVLKERYDAALIDERIVALAVGTRPDCISEEVAALLASYQETHDVWVELGLQTANDCTADVINRGYKKECFENALSILTEYNIPVVVHLIIGLPGETIDDVKKTVSFINQFKLWGIKIHSIYVMKNTVLEKMYLSGSYVPPSMVEYIESAIYVLTHISPDVIIHRLTGDCPKDLLVAPSWNTKKNEIINTITKKMESEHLYQGVFFKQEP